MTRAELIERFDYNLSSSGIYSNPEEGEPPDPLSNITVSTCINFLNSSFRRLSRKYKTCLRGKAVSLNSTVDTDRPRNSWERSQILPYLASGENVIDIHSVQFESGEAVAVEGANNAGALLVESDNNELGDSSIADDDILQLLMDDRALYHYPNGVGKVENLGSPNANSCELSYYSGQELAWLNEGYESNAGVQTGVIFKPSIANRRLYLQRITWEDLAHQYDDVSTPTSSVIPDGLIEITWLIAPDVVPASGAISDTEFPELFQEHIADDASMQVLGSRANQFLQKRWTEDEETLLEWSKKMVPALPVSFSRFGMGRGKYAFRNVDGEALLIYPGN